MDQRLMAEEAARKSLDKASLARDLEAEISAKRKQSNLCAESKLIEEALARFEEVFNPVALPRIEEEIKEGIIEEEKQGNALNEDEEGQALE